MSKRKSSQKERSLVKLNISERLLTPMPPSGAAKRRAVVQFKEPISTSAEPVPVRQEAKEAEDPDDPEEAEKAEEEAREEEDVAAAHVYYSRLVQQTTALVESAEPEAPVPQPPPPPVAEPRSRRRDSQKASETVSRQPETIVYTLQEPPSSVIAPSLEPSSAAFQESATADEASVSMANVLPLQSYNVAQRFLIQGALNAANFSTPVEHAKDPNAASTTTTTTTSMAPARNASAVASAGVLQNAFAQSQQPAMGVSIAAYCNHFTRTLANRGHAASDSATTLLPTPYVNNSASMFVATFVSAAIEDAPDENAAEHIPSEEQRAASSLTLFGWNESFQRSVRPGEFACARGERCWGMTLLDDRRRPLPKTRWPVFWFQDEITLVKASSERMKAEASQRYCVGCKFHEAGTLTNHAAMRNTRVGTNWVLSNAHVAVNVPGEYPIETTMVSLFLCVRGLCRFRPLFSYGMKKVIEIGRVRDGR